VGDEVDGCQQWRDSGGDQRLERRCVGQANERHEVHG
jgi:hypothetical protein